MAASIPTPIPLDPTFRHYKSHQAEEYAGIRPAYPAVLYEHIFTEHARGGGQFTQVLDVGCGPGKATQDLALAFDHALGLDPSLEMVKVAQQAGYKTRSGNGVRFEVGEAESLLDAAGVREGEVDMITAATAVRTGLAFGLDAVIYVSVEWMVLTYTGALVRYEKVLASGCAGTPARRHRGPVARGIRDNTCVIPSTTLVSPN